MTSFVTGFIIFLISHSANIFFQNLKTILIKRVGLILWKIIVSLLAILGFVLMVTHYQEAKSFSINLWSPTIPILYLSYILNFFAIWFVVSAYVPRNVIKLKLRHPMILRRIPLFFLMKERSDCGVRKKDERKDEERV